MEDKHPEEAFSAIDPKIKRIFCSDAGKAVVTLNETASNGDLKLFSITAHAMKSALAIVKEHEASETAYALENAGLQGDIDFITENNEHFIQTLKDLIEKFKPSINETINEDKTQRDVMNDISCLKEQLQIIKDACENYDDDTAYAALNILKQKIWRKETSRMLEQIWDMLYVYSDFEGAAKHAKAMMAYIVSLPFFAISSAHNPTHN